MAASRYQKLYNEALKAGASRQYQHAVELLTRIASEDDSLPHTLLYLGRAQHALGDLPRALVAVSAYLEKNPEDADGWFFLGRSYLSGQRPREAIRCIEKAMDLGRKDASCMAMLGYAYLRQKRVSRALKHLEQAHILAPDDPSIFRGYRNALFVTAVGHLNHGDYDSAKHILDFVIQNGGDSTPSRLYRASALREQGNLTAAIQDLKCAARDNPDDRSISLQLAVLEIATGSYQAGYTRMEELGVSLPGDSRTPWSAEALERWRALTALQSGQPKVALQTALALLRRGDKEPTVRVVAAQANFELGHFDRAIEHFKRASEADPESPAIRMALALACWEAGEYSAARSAAKAAARRGTDPADAAYLDILCLSREGAPASQLLPMVQDLMHHRPGDRRLMFILAECLYKTGRPDLAGAWFERVIELEPGEDLARLYLIAIAESLGDADLELERYRDYLEHFPDNNKIRREYIQKLVDAAKWQEAMSSLETGFAYDGASRTNNALLALCYRNTGQYRQAAIHYRQLLAAAPKNQDYLLALALCLVKSGSKSLAEELLRRGAAYLKTKAEPWLALGILLARAGKSEDAAAAFSTAAELAPADPRPLRNLAKLYRKSGSKEMAERYEAKAAKLSLKKP